jgi:ribosomal protein S18 acetylase RimI-like enzyme
VFLPFAPSAHSDDDVLRWVTHTLIPAGRVTVAEVNGVVVGMLALSSDDTHHWIDQLYVHPTHVGRGVGSRLLAHALASAPRPLRLYTFQQNTGARRFYERHGFAALRFSDGSANEERCPDVLYELTSAPPQT